WPSTRPPPALHSSPTRRSSDLRTEVVSPSRVELEGAAAPLAARDHDLPPRERQQACRVAVDVGEQVALHAPGQEPDAAAPPPARDRKSTRLNSSHGSISYAVFC